MKKNKSGKQINYLLWFFVIATLLFCFNYLFFDTLYIKCIIKSLTGYDCPTCGAQRAFVSFLKGDFVIAFWYNPYLFLLLLVFLVLIIIKKDYLSKRILKCIVIILVLLMIVWVVLRNLPIWQEFISTKISL